MSKKKIKAVGTIKLKELNFIRDSLAKYKMMVNSSKDYITLIDKNYTYQAANDAYLKARNYKREEVVGNTVAHVWGQDVFDDIIKDKIDRCLRGEIVNYQSIFEFEESEVNYMNITYYPCYDLEGKISHAVVVSHNVTEIKRSEEKLKHLAFHDPLTNLPNRLHFVDRIMLEISHAKRSGNMFALVFIDLDNFKKINDTFGHQMGDVLLQSVAQRLTKCLREGDSITTREDHIKYIDKTVCRMGGDEFIIIVPGLLDPKFTRIVVNRILEIFKVPFIIDEHELYITSSIGIALYPTDGEDPETLIKNADIAMYRAKDGGRNNYRFYSPSMSELTVELVKLENALHHALKHNEFIIYYQPKYDLSSNALIALEALVRWKSHIDGGIIAPDKFIPIAEETGLIIPIGEWVLNTVCKQTQQWHEKGYPMLGVSVNISARQFQDRNLVKKIRAILEETGINPNTLELEITESTMMQNIDSTIKILDELKKIGISISLDDFGTGYSSLKYIKKLPIDKLKIDQSFIRSMIPDDDNAAIVAAIITMAKQLGIKVIAEGVETEEQLSFLKDKKCDEVQGYLLCRPLPLAELFELLRKQYKK